MHLSVYILAKILSQDMLLTMYEINYYAKYCCKICFNGKAFLMANSDLQKALFLKTFLFMMYTRVAMLAYLRKTF